MKLLALLVLLSVSGVLLLTRAGAQLLGSWVWPASGGLACLAMVVIVVGWRRLGALLREGLRALAKGDKAVE